MSYVPVRELLERARTTFQRFEARARSQADLREDEQAAFVLEYVSHHSKAIAEILEDLPERGDDKALDTWVQYDRSVLGNEPEFDDDADSESLLVQVVQFDQKIVEAYRRLSTSMVPPRVQKMLANLADQLEARNQEYSKRLQELHDL